MNLPLPIVLFRSYSLLHILQKTSFLCHAQHMHLLVAVYYVLFLLSILFSKLFPAFCQAYCVGVVGAVLIVLQLSNHGFSELWTVLTYIVHHTNE